jgi:hypothetical protein
MFVCAVIRTAVGMLANYSQCVMMRPPNRPAAACLQNIDMPIFLSAANPNQVSSFQHLEVDTVDPTRKLHIFSGIAIPAFHIDDNDSIHRIPVVIDLNMALPDLQQAAAQVGLASISNEESEFVFAVDNARVDAAGATGALTLTADLALMGDESSLSRFGFQVVVVAGVHATGISGRVTWARALLDAGSLTSAQVASLLVVNANTIETIPGHGGNFSQTVLHPIASTIPQSLHHEREDFWVPYNFEHLPLNTPLRVTVQLSSAFSPGSSAGQVSGPFTISLFPNHLSEAGVDFVVSQSVVR